MFLIDTNVLSELARKIPNPNVANWFGKQESISVSVITLTELSYGIQRLPSEQSARLVLWYEKLLALPPNVFPIDQPTAEFAGSLKAKQEKSGKIMSQADALIAATSVMHGRILVTRNTKDFVDCGVALFNPFEERNEPIGV